MNRKKSGKLTNKVSLKTQEKFDKVVHLLYGTCSRQSCGWVINVTFIDYKQITLKNKQTKQKKKVYDASGFPAIKSTHYTFKHQLT